jgi:AraC-like DNA-binding protein
VVSDIRAQQAREHHRASAAAAAKAEHHRELRNKLIRDLRQADPQHWTYANLARAVGCSPELIAAIVKERV